MPLTKMMLSATAICGFLALMGCAERERSAAPAAASSTAGASVSPDELARRSKALFVEAGNVIQHPRCLNCHPTDGHPRQGDAMAFHQPPVVRGDDGKGLAPMQCSTCHQAENLDEARLPGHPAWHLAPLEMGWIDVSLHDICEQMKNPETNGGLDLEALHEHLATDSLVGWAWSPGEGREPAPGTQESFGRLVRAWIDSGAHCPDGEAGAFTGPAAPDTAVCTTCHG